MSLPQLSVPMCVIDPTNHRIKEVNEAFLRVVGYDATLVGEDYLTLVSSEDFSLAIKVFEHLSQTDTTCFALLDRNGNPIKMHHAFSFYEGDILDVMIPETRTEKSFREASLLEQMEHAVFCFSHEGHITYTNKAASAFFPVGYNLKDQPEWHRISQKLLEHEPFSLWCHIGTQEGFFRFRPIKDTLWLSEYLWGRKEVFSRLGEIIMEWNVPAILIDLRAKRSENAQWNTPFAGLGSSASYILEELEKIRATESYLTLVKPNKGFAYYRPLFFPFHQRLEILLVVLIDETTHIKKELVSERFSQVIEEMIHFSDDLLSRLSGDIEEIFETHHLSERERKLVGLIQQGMSNEEIAAHLYISIDTVKKSVSQLYRKFHVNNRIELLQRIYLPHRPKTPPKG